ncbi:amino acid adenylation domain-containing protein [Actinomadura fulvescens]|uniref:Phenyloxazoline synthase MbtB n=1 Tax=Actinomadura fulvescens TaxID=46160 RepID=A0ABN3Q254_9ACTN
MTSFPMTPVQEAYWVGRQAGQPLGGIACHMYFEFEGAAVDPVRLEHAVRTLARRHAMLRARFTDAGEQCVDACPVWPGPAVHDLRGLAPADRRERLARLRAELSHRALDVGRGQVFDVQLSLLPERRTRLHVDIDHLVADPASIRLLLSELAAAYAGDPAVTTAPPYDFQRHVAARRDQEESEAARRHWEQRLAEGTGRAPQLPSRVEPTAVSGAHFSRREAFLSAAQWQGLRTRAEAYGVRPESVLLAAYAHTLGRWSAEPRFAVSVPTFPRHPAHAGLGQVIGDFTALTVVPFEDGPFPDFLALVRKVDHEYGRSDEHSIYAGVRVLSDLARADTASSFQGAAVFTSLIDQEWLDARFARLLGEPVWALTETPQVLVDFQVYARNGGLHLVWDAPEEVFSAGVLDEMTTAHRDLLTRYADADWKHALPRTLPARQAVVRSRVNATSRPRSGHLLHQRFFELAGQAPERPAVIGSTGTRTRGELSERARRLAAALISHDLRPGDPVAVSLPPGPEQVVAVMGVLAAGGCYVPVGLDQPSARRELIYRTAGTRLLIGSGSGSGSGEDPTLISLAGSRAHAPIPRPVPRPESALAYVIFTSGSTGTPKGVEVEHRSAVNTLDDINARWSVGPSDRSITISALDFDLSVYDIFGLLGAGGSVLALDESERRDPERWLDLMARHQVTVWNSVPVLVDMLVSAAEAAGPPASLRLVITGGDWIGLDLPGRLHDLLPNATFVGSGGATEAAIYSNHMQVQRADPEWRSIPYGLPLGNQQFRVVDQLGRDCPDWVPGELWIGGAGVARGYRGDPRRTAAQFVTRRGRRWYRTGDRARYWPDGLVEFLGREDLQVKINGYRIELGEIEATLTAHPRVARAVTVVTGTGSTRQITAFVTSDREDLDIADLREHVAAHQPEYSRPAHYFQLPELPLTANGKIDRRALAQWSVPAPASASNEPPTGVLERELAEHWRRLLDKPVQARDVNFFEMGGNSILGMRLARELEERYGRRIEMRTLFGAPTIAALAQVLEEAAGGGTR